MNADSDENDNMKRAKEAIEKYFNQLTKGCGRLDCTNLNCASNPSFKKLSSNQAAAVAIQLAKDKAELCVECSSKSAKQFKPASSEPLIAAHQTGSTSSAANAHHDTAMDEDSDVVVPTTSKGSRGASASSSKSADLKSLDDALKDAVQYVTQMKENSDIDKNTVHLTEAKILKLVRKCKEKSSDNRMEVDQPNVASAVASSDPNVYFKQLVSLVQRVFQSYKSLAASFTFEKASEPSADMSLTMPTIPPFNIDFNSLRRSYTLLFSWTSNSDMDEIENALDHAVYALCISIRMLLKKTAETVGERELVQITHALLVVNELPILEDPKYMDRCAKIFYATLSELPVSAGAQIVRLWSKWHTDELKIFLNKLQQYITVCAISKNLDEESANRHNDDEDNDEANENAQQNCLHKNEGIAGAVGCLRLIYYASVLGGRLDPAEQIKREREMETEEIKFLESSLSLEENNVLSDSFNSFSTRVDPLETVLDLRAIDCRDPKIPSEQFVNEVVNKFIDIQHDYVEYVQQMQSVDQQAHRQHSKKHIFSFLAHPFFLVLAKKNLGLYYDNKIKMMRERRNNIMLSLFEGSVPMPYFKIRLQRNNLLVDALSLIELQEQENAGILRKQLFIEFENEQGIDQGGVSKEFFQLAIDELLNKGYTFFTFDETTNYYWFTPCTLETEKEFRLIGILFGIAIYNNVLLDVQFPPVFFRKLMGKLGTLEDLYYSHPQLHQSFTSILEFQGSDEEFEETFMLTFQISLTDTFGSVVSFNLKENGDCIQVTKKNRQEFVDLYADFVLNKGIDDAFKAFKRGFIKITYNSPLSKWYSPEELEILLCGSKVMDWKSLETSTLYDSGFEADHPYVKQFWSLFDDFTVDQKRLFLKFTTGTDRCPHGGLSELKLTIARNGPDTEKLPTAHTCFNVLLLPEYSSKQKLKEKLLKAIQYSRGFGLS